MFIKSIYLNNYRCHKNSKIDFFNEGNKGQISIIEGGDGDGKTCIFNAIGWCLYGEETSKLLSEPAQNLGIPNIGLSGTGKLEDLSVEMWIGFEGKSSNAPSSARIKRSANFRVNEISSQELSVEIYYDMGSPRLLMDNDAQNYIDDIAPRDLVEFYMFNGEYLSSGKNVKGRNIDASIKGQFKIGAIESMLRLIKEVEAGYRRSADRAAGNDASEITAQIEYNDQKIDECKSDKDRWERSYIDYQMKKQSAEEELERTKMEIKKIEGKKSAVQEFNSKNNDLNDISKRLDEEYLKLHKVQYESAYLALSKRTNEESYKLVKEEIGRANLPPKIKEEFAKDLLAQHKCICGRSLEDSSNEYKMVEGMLLDSRNEGKKAMLVELSPQLNQISGERVKFAMDRINEIKGNIKWLFQRKINLSDEISHWKGREKGLSEEEENTLKMYKDAEKDFDKFKTLLSEANANLEKTVKKIEELTNTNKGLTEKEEKISIKAQEGSELREYQKISRQLGEIISNLVGRITSMFIESLQTEVNNLISEIRGLSHLSVDIKPVGNSIEVTYIDKFIELDGKSWISEGQNQIISITLIAAYMSVLKKLGAGIAEAPFVVMDHPFSDLGLPRKEELLKSFGSIFKDTKVIILTPPGDFNLDPVAGIIASRYVVHNDPHEKACYAKEVGI